MSKTLKQIRAGRLVCAVVYTAPAAGDSSRVRADKQHASNEAQEKLNVRTSLEKLERVLAANFDNGDLYVTFSYDDKHLPENRDAAIRRMRSFIPKLRKARRSRGAKLKYVYVTEQWTSENKRLHHHMVLNSTGDDIEELEKLWIYGSNVEVRRLTFDKDNPYAKLAEYMTKEPREWGRGYVGERMWNPSVGLNHPEPERFEVPDHLELVVPANAEVVDRYRTDNNGFGSYAWVKYLLPPSKEKKKTKSRKRKKKE